MARKRDSTKKHPKVKRGSDILYERYIAGKPEREKSFRRVAAEMSLGEYIREFRERREITQQQLADAIGTKRSAISRLESADYQGHTVDLLCRIVKALNGKLVVRIDLGTHKLARELTLAE